MLKQLLFKKLGNHWYLDIPHDDPADLQLDDRLERFLSTLDPENFGIVDRVYLVQENYTDNVENLIEFRDEDLLRYFTTDDDFLMIIYIGKHRFTISSRFYYLLEREFQFDFHQCMYKIMVY